MGEKLRGVAFRFGPDFSVELALEILADATGVATASPKVTSVGFTGQTFMEGWGFREDYYLIYISKEDGWYIKQRAAVDRMGLEVIDVEAIANTTKEEPVWSYL
ncbi:hypothetical protein [Vibrio phage MJW]